MKIKAPLNFKYPLNCIESVIATQTKRHGSHNSNAYVIVYYRKTFFRGGMFFAIWKSAKNRTPCVLHSEHNKIKHKHNVKLRYTLPPFKLEMVVMMFYYTISKHW